MAGALVLLWLFVFCMMVRTVVSKRLLWPEDENLMRVLGLTPSTRMKA